MKLLKLIVTSLLVISFHAFGKDELSANLPNDEGVTKQELPQEKLDLPDTKNKDFIESIGLPEGTKRIYVENMTDLPEYPIIERFLFCLKNKIDSLGQSALSMPILNVKELHYIISGCIVENVGQIPQEMIEEELVKFNEIFYKKTQAPFSEYEKQAFCQSAAQQYAIDLLEDKVWNCIKEREGFKNIDDNLGSIKIELIIAKAPKTIDEEWKSLQLVVQQCIEECKQAGENCPSFSDDTQKHINTIFDALKSVSCFEALFNLGVHENIIK